MVMIPIVFQKLRCLSTAVSRLCTVGEIRRLPIAVEYCSRLNDGRRERANEGNEDSQQILQTIRALRSRLLDLSNRNAFLRFHHGGRSRRNVHVIDEVPEVLYETFTGTSNSAMTLAALPESIT